MRKRILSIVLVVVMCFTMMPTTTFAAGETEYDHADPAAETLVSACTCGTDDDAVHATDCPAYVAPEIGRCCVDESK